jgi:hypothetical protein
MRMPRVSNGRELVLDGLAGGGGGLGPEAAEVVAALVTLTG